MSQLISALSLIQPYLPLYKAIQDKLIANVEDSAAIQRFKQLLTADMGSRYQDQAVSLCLTSFLDPRFKTFAHLSHIQQAEVSKSISDELLVYISSREEHEDVIPYKAKLLSR